jgi:CCR4-NOT transcription complex subunit 2
MGHNTAGIRSPTSPMGSSQPYEQFVPHMRLAQTLSKTPPVPDRFGLLGLLSVIRMTDPDLNTLALGTDLTTLGLNLNSPDCLYASFTSPFADGPSRKEPEYHLPLCYYMQPPMQPAESKVQLFSDETLIYAFYALPRDLLQVTAAVELYNRDWRFHKALQLWFIRVDSEPVAKTTGYERGTYIFFDVTNWKKVKKENFLLYYDQIAELPKLLPLQPIGPPSGSPALTSPAQALNQHSSSKDSPLVQARSNRRGFDMD